MDINIIYIIYDNTRTIHPVWVSGRPYMNTGISSQDMQTGWSRYVVPGPIWVTRLSRSRATPQGGPQHPDSQGQPQQITKL